MQDKVQFRRYGKLSNVPYVETTTFLLEGTNGVGVGDTRLLKLEGLEGRWFWFASENFLGDASLHAAMDKGVAINPYAVPLKPGMDLITEAEYNDLLNQNKVTIEAVKSQAAKEIAEHEESQRVQEKLKSDRKKEILAKLGLSEEEVDIVLG